MPAVEVQFEDGRYFARTENVTALDGSEFFAFIAFDNMTKAKAFNDSMKNTTALRTRVTKSRSFIVEGSANQCPLSGVKRTLRSRVAMSANDPKRTLTNSSNPLPAEATPQQSVLI